MKNKSKKQIVLIMTFSFILPAIIMAFAFYNTQIYPGGTNTVLIYDMHAQFLPIYASLRYLGNSDNSLFFTFFGALGNNALPNYSTYLVNPLSWVTVLFPLSKLPDVLYFLTILRIGLCGLGFSIYLLFGRREYREKRYPVAIIILSCCYALMSFNIVYSMCLNWLDITFLLPLVLTSLEQLMEGKRGISFVLLYTYAIYNSFQLSYIMGIFLILYLAFRLIDKQGMWKSVVPRFAIRVLLALGMSMPIFIPMMKAAGGRFGVEDEVKNGLTYFGIKDLLGQFLSCKYDSIRTGGLPFVFCGTITIVLVVIYLLRIAENVKKKACAMCIILLYLASFCIIPLNKMWHGFSETLSFPGRYSYTLCCFLLILAYESMPIVYKLVALPDRLLPCIGCIMMCIVLSEQYLNASYIMASANLESRYRLRTAYENFISKITDVQSHIQGNEFYRIGRGNSGFTFDDGMLLGYNGIAYFSSFFERDFMDFMGLMGYSQNEHLLEDIGSSPVMENILGVRYDIVFDDEMSGREVLYRNSPYVLTYNRHSLPVGFIMGNSEDLVLHRFEYTSAEDDGNAFAYHELLLSDIYGENCDIYDDIDYIFTEIDDAESARHICVDFTANDNKPIWLYCKNATEEQMESSDNTIDEDQKTVDSISEGALVTVNGKAVNRVRTKYSTTCTYVGAFKPGEKVHIDIKDKYYFGDPWIVSYDEEKCSHILDDIKEKNGIKLLYHHNGIIKGEIVTSSDDSFVMFTLPYMDGYRIQIDGKQSDYEDYRGALMMVRIPTKGKHIIEVSYLPPGFVSGLIIGGCSIILFFVLITMGRFGNYSDLTNLINE